MVLGEGALVPSARETPVPRTSALVAIALSCLGLLAAGILTGEHVRLVAAGTGAWLAFSGARRGRTPREVRVRAWIAAAAGVWAVSEVTRFIGIPGGAEPIIVGCSLAGMTLAAVGSYVAVVHGRLRPADEAALYLDLA